MLYAAERIHVDAAKFAAVDFVSAIQFGPQDAPQPEVVAEMREMLVWTLA